MIHSTLKSERGFATLIVLIMLGMLTLIGIAAISTSDDEVTIAGNELQEMRAFYAADAGLEVAATTLQNLYDSTGLPPTVMPSGEVELNMCVVTYETADDGPAVASTMSDGSFSGLNAYIKSFTLDATAISEVDNAQIKLTQTFETSNIPIFQWAIFFNEDLWAQPAFDLNVDGRVHVNGDMYLQSSYSGQALTFMDQVTCGGDIHAGLPSGSYQNGDVLFTDAAGNAVSMQQGGNWIDSDDANWYDTASSLWGGEVQDASFGHGTLNLPLNGSSDPHKLIERGADNPDSYEHDAGLKIIDGIPYAQVDDFWVDVSGSLPAGTIMSSHDPADPTNFYDAHEKKQVFNTQIDMGLLQASGYFPANGVIYVSDHTDAGSDMNGVSLVNGSSIGNPLTLVSENPLYIQGDFNTVNKQPVASIADATTFLSNNWDPANSWNDYTTREGSATTVNLSMITGDLEPTESNYGGGLENLPRFLEDWDGVDFNYMGSMIEMWRSQQATGTWRYIQASDAYYSAPTRNWGYDTDLEDLTKLPPLTPMIRVFRRTGWSQEYVHYSPPEAD